MNFRIVMNFSFDFSFFISCDADIDRDFPGARLSYGAPMPC